MRDRGIPVWAALLILVPGWYVFGCSAPTSAPSTDEPVSSLAQASPLPRPIDPAQIEAARAALDEEPKVLDIMGPEAGQAVEWTVAVKSDGSSRFGYASYLCMVLGDHDVVGPSTSVRVVDVDYLVANPGDFRGASLGHAHCETGDDLGI
jgi:hypothetical protein